MADTARHLALWMSWEDTIRVAELKTRDSRFARVRGEVRARADQVLAIQEYLHPRLQEIAETLPAPLGRYLLSGGWLGRLVDRLASKGRVVETSSLRGFLQLWAVSRMKRWRRASLRWQIEIGRIDAWLTDVRAAAQRGDIDLATEIVRCQRLVKGYGDTHARSWRHFGMLQAQWRRPGAISPARLAALRAAALADEQGQALAAALAEPEGVGA
jgi:indolepyruvate ferredoxin oxidoreductase beta subunit